MLRSVSTRRSANASDIRKPVAARRPNIAEKIAGRRGMVGRNIAASSTILRISALVKMCGERRLIDRPNGLPNGNSVAASMPARKCENGRSESSRRAHVKGSAVLASSLAQPTHSSAVMGQLCPRFEAYRAKADTRLSELTGTKPRRARLSRKTAAASINVWGWFTGCPPATAWKPLTTRRCPILCK